MWLYALDHPHETWGQPSDCAYLVARGRVCETPLSSSNGHSDTFKIEITTTQSRVLRLQEGRDALEINQILCYDAWALASSVRRRPQYWKMSSLISSCHCSCIGSIYSNAILFFTLPNPSIFTSTTSPSFSHKGSFIPMATPAGVPVIITVPASSVVP